jgi:hypothetical protein
MATPARFTELKCYACGSSHWDLVSDYPGTDMTFVAPDSRTYTCPVCSHVGTDFMVLQQSPHRGFCLWTGRLGAFGTFDGRASLESASLICSEVDAYTLTRKADTDVDSAFSTANA